MNKSVNKLYKFQMWIYISNVRFVHTADALRVLIINRFGGFYADSDFVILKSLKKLKNVIASDQVSCWIFANLSVRTLISTWTRCLTVISMTITIVSWSATPSQTPSSTSTKEPPYWRWRWRSWRKSTNPRAGLQEDPMSSRDRCCCCAGLDRNTHWGYRWPEKNSAQRNVEESPCWTTS